MIRLVQIQKGSERRVAVVEEPHLRLLSGTTSIYGLASGPGRASLTNWVAANTTGERLDYDAVCAGRSDWRLLSPIDHPDGPWRCLVSGTGLTHLGSARNRQAMHKTDAAGASSSIPTGAPPVAPDNETDSMKMFRWGVEGGKPAPGKIGAAPEWFYKGNGSMLRAHGEPLEIPGYAEDGGEEGEIAGIYLIDADGQPVRLGMAIGNEFSDHQFEKKNYLNLAGSKLRTSAIGPELVIGHDFQSVPGTVTIERAGATLWSQPILTGEKEMCHSLANLEHHHFKFEVHRRPGDIHVHYYGACSLSFGAGLRLAAGDVMQIAFDGFGRPLRSPLKSTPGGNELITPRVAQ